MPRKKDPPAQDYTGLRNYRKSMPEMEQLFGRTKRVLHEMLGRLEEFMFREDNKVYDPVLAKQAKELSQAVTSTGQMFFKIQDMAKAAAEGMTTDEQIDAVCDMVEGWGRNNRLKFWRRMRELEMELNAADQLYKGNQAESTGTDDSAGGDAPS